MYMDDGMTECECTNRKLNSMIFCFFFCFCFYFHFLFLSIFSFFFNTMHQFVLWWNRNNWLTSQIEWILNINLAHYWSAIRIMVMRWFVVFLLLLLLDRIINFPLTFFVWHVFVYMNEIWRSVNHPKLMMMMIHWNEVNIIWWKRWPPPHYYHEQNEKQKSKLDDDG